MLLWVPAELLFYGRLLFYCLVLMCSICVDLCCGWLFLSLVIGFVGLFGDFACEVVVWVRAIASVLLFVVVMMIC